MFVIFSEAKESGLVLLLSLEDLLHAVEGGARLEPFNLAGVEGVVQLDLALLAIGLGEHSCELLQQGQRI